MNPRPPGPPLPGRCALTVTPKTTERLLEASLPAHPHSEDPQVLGEELAGPRAAGRPQLRPRAAVSCSELGGGAQPFLPRPSEGVTAASSPTHRSC